MMTHTPITAEELTDLLGELDPFVVARLLAIEPSAYEVGEAIAALEEESSYGVPHEPSSTRVFAVLRILEDLLYDEVEPAAGYDYAVPA
jgi:hypothetical protein